MTDWTVDRVVRTWLIRVVLLTLLACAAALAAAGCGTSSSTSSSVDPVEARSSAWVKEANAFCRPRDRAIRSAETAAKPVFFTPAVIAEIHAEIDGLRQLGVFRRIPLLAYKWRIAAHGLRERQDPGRVDGHLIAAHRVAERYGIRCHLGAIPLHTIPGS